MILMTSLISILALNFGRMAFMNDEYNCLLPLLSGVTLDNMIKGKHITDTEKMIQKNKERSP